MSAIWSRTATSHDALDDEAFQQEVLNVPRVLGRAVKLHLAGKL
jgi:hypothetical protein